MELNKKKLKEFYEKFMVDYEIRIFRDYGHLLRIIHTLNLMSNIPSFSSILDIDCDGGIITNYVRDYERLIVGIDISRRSLTKAKKSSRKVDYILTGTENLCFRDKSFDVSLALEVLEHLTNYERCLREIMKVTKKFIIISIPSSPTLFGLIAYRFAYMLFFK
jgi:2-polyprenyl-3-methyl-5-hydroxy-6-metoxy-1,4-benzoquinol methylase